MGIVASTVCAVHCTVGALLLGATGAARAFSDERIEVAFAAFAIVVAAGSLTHGYRRHRGMLPMMMGAAGTLALGGVRIIEPGSGWAEVVVSVIGAGLLVGAHWLNRRRLRAHHACCAPTSATTCAELSREPL